MTETNSDSGPDINALMGDLIERLSAADTEPEIEAALISSADLVRDIAKACESTRLYQRSGEAYAAFMAEFESAVAPAERLIRSWAWLTDRIANSPTRAHMHGSVRLCMPLVARYLPVS